MNHNIPPPFIPLHGFQRHIVPFQCFLCSIWPGQRFERVWAPQGWLIAVQYVRRDDGGVFHITESQDVFGAGSRAHVFLDQREGPRLVHEACLKFLNELLVVQGERPLTPKQLWSLAPITSTNFDEEILDAFLDPTARAPVQRDCQFWHRPGSTDRLSFLPFDVLFIIINFLPHHTKMNFFRTSERNLETGFQYFSYFPWASCEPWAVSRITDKLAFRSWVKAISETPAGCQGTFLQWYARKRILWIARSVPFKVVSTLDGNKYLNRNIKVLYGTRSITIYWVRLGGESYVRGLRGFDMKANITMIVGDCEQMPEVSTETVSLNEADGSLNRIWFRVDHYGIRALAFGNAEYSSQGKDLLQCFEGFTNRQPGRTLRAVGDGLKLTRFGWYHETRDTGAFHWGSDVHDRPAPGLLPFPEHAAMKPHHVNRLRYSRILESAEDNRSKPRTLDRLHLLEMETRLGGAYPHDLTIFAGIPDTLSLVAVSLQDDKQPKGILLKGPDTLRLYGSNLGECKHFAIKGPLEYITEVHIYGLKFKLVTNRRRSCFFGFGQPSFYEFDPTICIAPAGHRLGGLALCFRHERSIELLHPYWTHLEDDNGKKPSTKGAGERQIPRSVGNDLTRITSSGSLNAIKEIKLFWDTVANRYTGLHIYHIDGGAPDILGHPPYWGEGNGFEAHTIVVPRSKEISEFELPQDEDGHFTEFPTLMMVSKGKRKRDEITRKLIFWRFGGDAKRNESVFVIIPEPQTSS